MEKITNWVGQLRLYSLVDLWLLLAVATNINVKVVGGLLLHISFLVLLETRHRDRGRIPFPQICFPLLLIAGTLLYGNLPYVIGCVFLGGLYTQKKTRPFGYFSPLVRGLQTWILIGGIAGLQTPLAITAGLLMILRNLIGDVRDVEKDREEGVETLPVVMGLTGHYPYAHQLAIHATTLSWYLLSQGGISLWCLVVCLVVQATTYRLTQR